MAPVYRIDYNLLLNDPVLKLISLFNLVIFFVYVFFFFYHTSTFHTFSYLSLPFTPVINLILLNAFTCELVAYDNRVIIYKRTNFYFFKKVIIADDIALETDKKFYKVILKNSQDGIPTRIIYPVKERQHFTYLKSSLDMINIDKT